MLRKLLAVLGFAALSTLPLQAQDSATVAKAVNDLEAQWGVSLVAANWAAVESFLTPDFVYTGSNGKRYDRTAYVTMLRDGKTRVTNVAAGSYTVIVSGSTAVHLGEATLTFTDKQGRTTKAVDVWTDTWVLQPNGMWLCIAAQSATRPVK